MPQQRLYPCGLAVPVLFIPRRPNTRMTKSSMQSVETTVPESSHDWQRISAHVNSCAYCRFAIASQHQGLSKTGCPECRDLLSHVAWTHSPVHLLHFSDELIEEHFFRRLSSFELRLFNIHAACCSACTAKLHNERLFLYALQAALENVEDLPPSSNKDGAAFQVSAA
jgi:hypothetical protein